MIKVSSAIKLNMPKIKQLTQAQVTALEQTAEALHTEVVQLQAVEEALNLIFKPEDVEKICNIKKGKKKLSAKSLMVIVEEAMNLVMGEDEAGE